MKKHILEIDSIQKQYENKLLLSDVYLKCETGEIIGLLGRNGSGKSTFMKIIFGVQKSIFKFVKIDSVVKKYVFKEISYLPQENFIPNTFSVQKAIQLSISNEKIENFYDDSMINSIKLKKINQLSGGELRYLEIKLILSNSSKFVLLDEPYNGISPLLIDKINSQIIQYSKEKGIIITDHNYVNILDISTKLILLKEGKLHHLKDKYELINNGYLKPGMI